MNTNETERDTPYDRACRDPRDNCPTEGAVLKREWRQKTATIAILSATVEQQAAKFERLRAAAAALLEDMDTPIDGIEANLMQAVRDALGKPGAEPVEPVAEAKYDGTLRWLEPHGVGLHRIQGPLYTAPPQRKPLTDEEIDHIDACIDKFTPLREGKRLFARAVERALEEKNRGR